MSRSKIASIVSEFLGAMILSLAALSLTSVIMSFFVASTVALTVFVLIMGLGQYSGGHFNPAVTFAVFMSKKIDLARAIIYVAAQFLGSLFALLLFSWWIGGVAKVKIGEFDTKLLVSEAVGAGILVFGVLSTLSHKYESFKTSATVGGSLFVGVMVASIAGIPVLNPAVALASRHFELHYLIGPLLGAAAAQVLYSVVYDKTMLAKPNRSFMKAVTPGLKTETRIEKATQNNLTSGKTKVTIKKKSKR
jgi:glycerol uptake facilitator-like aquaporin